MMFWYGNGMGGWGYAFMTISTVLVWILIIAGAVAMIRYFGRSPGFPGPRPTPEGLLAERFARGEIDEQEYQHRLETLQANRRAPSRSRRGSRSPAWWSRWGPRSIPR